MFFGHYETTSFFPISVGSPGDRRPQILSHILAATVGQNLNISNLDDPVVITFKPQIQEGVVNSKDQLQHTLY